MSPHRAIRAVMINEIEDFDEFIGPGVKEIDDNNQYPTFQFQDSNGWKNFCTAHANELRQSVLRGERIKNLPSWYRDSNSGRIIKCTIRIDLEQKTQSAKTTRKIRAVWVTPILQLGKYLPSGQGCGEPVWSAKGPRLPGIGPSSAARSH